MAEREQPSFRVRRAVEDDVPAMIELRGEVAAEGRWIAAEAPIDVEGDTARYLDYLHHDDHASFVALGMDGAIIGNAGVSLAPYAVTELGMLVAAPWRGRGVGSALLEAVIDWSREQGAHKVTLQAWPHNDAAIALYEKFGFAREGLLRRHYRRRNGELWDAVVMGLVLDDEAPGAST